MSGRDKSTIQRLRLVATMALLCGLNGAIGLLVLPSEAQAQVVEKAAIKGFRSALFGMNEADVRKAAARDLGVKPQDIQAELHPKEKTRLLSVRVKNLLPESGAALVVYHFGFRSKTLSQVSVVWGRPVDPSTPPQQLVATANSLRDFFQQQQFESEGLLLNAPAPGGIVVFRGFDAVGRMVALVLGEQEAEVAAAKQGAGGGQAASPPAKSLSLQLSYVLSPKKPDVFVIEKGQF